jgi:hypothetical protein
MTVRRSALLASGALVVFALGFSTWAGADDPAADPIPDDPVLSRLGVVVQEVATFPKSEPVPEPGDRRLMRHARINYLGEVPDGSRRLYVPDLNGTLYLLRGGIPQRYLDVKEAVGANFLSGRGVGSGFGFVTFHPEFRTNGRFYSVHTEAFDALTMHSPDHPAQPNTIMHSVITEWTAQNPQADVFTGSRRELLRLGFARFVHGIQQIDFNPTARPGDEDYGLLYIAVGDGGIGVSSGDPQNLSVPYGKVLRIDPGGTNSTSGRYGIPRSNPFVGTAGALSEIYAYGMRDPHRFSWDPGGRQRMLLSHIGEKDIEAIYDVRAGDNLGWSEREGPFVYNREDRCNVHTLPADDAKHGYTYPVVAYDHDPPPGYPCGADVGHAVAGGFVYRGRALPELRGKYLFGDIVDGRVLYAEERELRRGGALATIHELAIFDGTRELTMSLAAGDTRVDLRFGRDAEAELYLLSKARGTVWKIVGTRRVARSSDVFPTLLPNLIARYDFEHPTGHDGSSETDQGPARTDISLIHGGRMMRVRDGAYPASRTSIQLKRVNRGQPGNGDWLAGIYSSTGVPGLRAFNGASGASILGWFKFIGPNSGSSTSAANSGLVLASLLTGDSDGQAARVALELTSVNGELRLAATGRRLDGGNSQIFAAAQPVETLLPRNVWLFLTATFDFSRGAIALYRNGKPITGSNTIEGDPWQVTGPGTHRASATDPRGITIGGRFPQNTREANTCDCRADNVMFVDRVLMPLEINQQYRRMISAR